MTLKPLMLIPTLGLAVLLSACAGPRPERGLDRFAGRGTK